MTDDRGMQALARQLREPLKGYFAHLDSFRDANTYTPTYAGGTAAGTTTYTTQAGFYERVFDLVFFHGRVTWTAATGTGNARISLPFTALNTTNMYYAISVWTNNVTFANQGILVPISPNNAYFEMYSPLTNAASAIVQMEAAGDVIWGGWFRIA